MSTKYSAEVFNTNNEWWGVALFGDIVPHDAMIVCCQTIMEAINQPLRDVRLTDMDTGEILWLYTDNGWNDYEPAEI